MSEPRFGNRIRQLLNQGAQLEPRVAARLRAARAQALERQRGAGAAGERLGGVPALSFRLAVPLALLVLGIATLPGWQEKRAAAELAELDTQLLADDLPIDAYLDEGFEAWLKRKPRAS